VLTVMAVIGVLALMVTLLTPSAQPAPKPRRTVQPTLKGALKQLLATPPTARQLINPGPVTCPVASGSCSSNPCVIYVQSGAQPVATAVGGVQLGSLSKRIATVPRLQTPFSSQPCTRHALPQTMRVSALAAPHAVPSSAPVVVATPAR
jgi:hypothetical protein